MIPVEARLTSVDSSNIEFIVEDTDRDELVLHFADGVAMNISTDADVSLSTQPSVLSAAD
jgi:hypothetical protein